MARNMRWLLFAIIFCAFSLLFAEVFSSLLVSFKIINAFDQDTAHTIIMLVMLIVFIYLLPRFNEIPNKQNSGGTADNNNF